MITCFDGAHLRREVEGTLRQHDIDYVLVWRMLDQQADKPKRQIHFTLHRELLRLAMKTFWSEDQRLGYYRTFALKMQPCSGALQRLKERGMLTPEIKAFAKARFELNGLPMPRLD